MGEDGSLMHKFLGDAAHIDAGATKAPRGAHWSRLNEVQHSHFGTQKRSLFGCCQAPWTTAYDNLKKEVALDSSAGSCWERSTAIHAETAARQNKKQKSCNVLNKSFWY